MENPSSWNLLIASLNTADAEHNPAVAWSFLAVQGLVKSDPRSCSAFLSLTEALTTERRKRGPMPGPSFGAHLAERLSALILAPGRQPAPMGEIARKRWKITAGWRRAPDK